MYKVSFCLFLLCFWCLGSVSFAACLSGVSSSQSKSSSLSVTSGTFLSGQTLPKINFAKVQEVWLNLHNTERATKSLTPFVYSTNLQDTAFAWAKYLANIRKTTHQRKKGDGYYSYASIKNRFLNQGIVFAGKEKNGQPLFTENLGRGYYTCKQADCTDTFIKALKTSRAFFMSEKGKKSRPHYNAIMGNFTRVGLGVSLVGNKYYLVAHYAQDLSQ